MTALEEIKKALEGLIEQAEHVCLGALTPRDIRESAKNLADPVEKAYVALSTLESLQRENEEKSAWIKSATIEITKAIGGGSEMFTPHGDEFRVDPAFVASFIQYRRERHAESKKASIQKERELIARAEAAESEVQRLRDLLRFSHDTLWEINPSNYDHDDVCKLNEASVEVILAIAPEVGETALASTGGEHHAE
ncbi:hypothetical protein FLX27_29955 [Agrobacterium tumefaciens]|nr:hypothetical protein [Agrobacterium tumefaciens]TQN55357.1 hypothetical protein FLX27_29955 [Agrobacterium tumefaciens]